ncbi:MAG: protein-L-isoaspartate(D-aspartate) O-methyltransferase [Candidatus Omnitrophota bacterium]
MDYAVLRKRMVEEQIIARGINDNPILEAFYKVERHRFVPEDLQGKAYEDYPLPIGDSQTISQPYIVAVMTEALQLERNEKVLEIGTGSGYQAAILAELAAEVYSIERIPELGKRAAGILKELGYQNITLKMGDGTLGWIEESPFDRIIITAASEKIPLPLIEQLREGGRIIAPLGGTFSQMLTLGKKKNSTLLYEKVCGCTFVPLVGKHAAN